MCDTTFQAGEIVLRHDVDLDIAPAFEMAKLEELAGVRSTYFILTTCHSYNPGSSMNRRMLKDMAANGFEIGLHFDPSIYGDASDADLLEAARAEAAFLESLTGQPVESVSIHTPSIHGKYPVFDCYRNAYDPRIFNDEVYMSDSRMDFRGKDPYEFVKRAANKPIQILLHPMHFTQEGTTYPTMYVDYIRNHITAIDEEHTSVNSGYAALKNGPLIEYLANPIQQEGL